MIECSKTKFSNEKQALFYLKKLQSTSHRSKVPQNAYLCPRCHLWHLTSGEKEQTQLEKCRKELVAKEKIIKEKNFLITQLELKVRELKEKNKKFTGTWRHLNKG